MCMFISFSERTTQIGTQLIKHKKTDYQTIPHQEIEKENQFELNESEQPNKIVTKADSSRIKNGRGSKT